MGLVETYWSFTILWFYGCYPRGKLTCLIKYNTVEVKEMVKNIIQLPPKEEYKTEKQIMHKLYGDPNRLIAAYRKEIKQWPQIKPGDAEAYRKFHNFLRKLKILH